MKILALTAGDQTYASTQYRLLQYRERLRRDFGMNLDYHRAKTFQAWDTLADYDLVILQKKLLPLSQLRKLRRGAKRLFYDVDDAIWQPYGEGHTFFTRWRTNLRLKQIVSTSDGIIAANEVLASHLRQWSPRVSVVPMGLPAEEWTRHPLAATRPQVTIGWAGSPTNLGYLSAIGGALGQVKAAHPEVELIVYSGKPPQLPFPCTHLPFQPGTEAEAVSRFSIGLLPLPTNAFAQGKSPIKGLQYLAAGVAVVATPVGATRALFEEGKTALFAQTPEEWVTALTRLIEQEPLRLGLGAQGRQAFASCYSLEKTCAQLARLFQG